jgi:hypothetical protein
MVRHLVQNRGDMEKLIINGHAKRDNIITIKNHNASYKVLDNGEYEPVQNIASLANKLNNSSLTPKFRYNRKYNPFSRRRPSRSRSPNRTYLFSHSRSRSHNHSPNRNKSSKKNNSRKLYGRPRANSPRP